MDGAQTRAWQRRRPHQVADAVQLQHTAHVLGLMLLVHAPERINGSPCACPMPAGQQACVYPQTQRVIAIACSISACVPGQDYNRRKGPGPAAIMMRFGPPGCPSTKSVMSYTPLLYVTQMRSFLVLCFATCNKAPASSCLELEISLPLCADSCLNSGDCIH